MSDSYLIPEEPRTLSSFLPDEGEGTLLPERDPMTKRNTRAVTVTRADGTTYELPAYDRKALRLIRENPNLSDYDRAMLQIACPVCNQRPGRICRTNDGRKTRHRERIEAYTARRSPIPRQESDRLGS